MRKRETICPCIRRVLFAGQRFRLLCRVARDDGDTSWVPLKLQQVVSSLFPELGEAIEKFNRGDLFRAEIDSGDSKDAHQGQVARNALRVHALWIANSNGVDLSGNDIAEVDTVAGEYLSEFETEQDKRKAFWVIENHMAKRYGLEIDPEAAKDSRRRARIDAGASMATVLGPEPESDTQLPDHPEAGGHKYFLDSEFVAIYW